MATFGYIRVSTIDQNTERQLAELPNGVRLDRTYTDKASGKDAHRPELERMLTRLRSGDHVIVHSMDRLARNLQDLLDLVKQINEAGASIQFLKEGQTFSPDKEENAQSVLLLQMLGAFAQFERALIRERQREGIILAKARGAYKGRKPIEKERFERAVELVAKGSTVIEAARATKIGKSSLYNYLKAKKEAPKAV